MDFKTLEISQVSCDKQFKLLNHYSCLKSTPRNMKVKVCICNPVNVSSMQSSFATLSKVATD